MNDRMEPWQIVYALLGFLCTSARENWEYPYHLGIGGLYRLHRAMVNRSASDEVARCENVSGRPGKLRTRIFVVGELPEELASYRHHVARLLNVTEGNHLPGGERRVYSFTGDIGLHISLTSLGDPVSQGGGGGWQPMIRCAFCNYNNETVLREGNYHAPGQVLETPLKRLDSAMMYLCVDHDHHPESQEMPLDFLNSPNLRVI